MFLHHSARIRKEGSNLSLGAARSLPGVGFLGSHWPYPLGECRRVLNVGKTDSGCGMSIQPAVLASGIDRT